jgi:hypothetical protein
MLSQQKNEIQLGDIKKIQIEKQNDLIEKQNKRQLKQGLMNLQ